MSTQICNPCAEGQVCLDNLDRYSLQDDVYYFVLNCPPNFFCGGNNTMYLVCCDGTIEQTTFTAGMTAAQRQAAISALVGRCLMKDAFCTGTDTDPNPGDGTNGRPGNDPNDPLQLYGNRPMSSTSYCADGSPFTYTVPAGLFFARSQSAADTAARNFARTLSSSLKICLTGPLRTCCNNVAYSSTMVASGGVPGNFRWAVIGSLPTGLVAIPIGHNGLRIQGIPTTNGNYTFTIRATDSAGNFMAKVITIKVWGIMDVTLPDGTLAADYDYQLTTTNGTAPYVYTLVGGGFPLGVDITSSGLITGVAGEEGTFSPQIKVTDHQGRTCTKEFSITVIAGCPTPSPLTYTIPIVPDNTWSTPDPDWTDYGVISGTQKIAKHSTDTNLGCIEIVDFSGAPAVTARFLMNSETGWQSAGSVYEPLSGLIVAVCWKAANNEVLAFFDPVLGYQSHVVLSTSSNGNRPWNSSLMLGQGKKVIFFRGSVQSGNNSYALIANTETLTAESFWTITVPLPWGLFGEGGFCYSCEHNEFYFVGQTNLFPTVQKLFAYSAVDGTLARQETYTYVTKGIDYIASTGKIVIQTGGGMTIRLYDPITLTESSSVNIDDISGFPYMGSGRGLRYNFYLDLLMVGGVWDENPDPPYGESSGLLFLEPDLSWFGFCKTLTDYNSTFSAGIHADKSNGVIYTKFEDTVFNAPYFQIIPSII